MQLIPIHLGRVFLKDPFDSSQVHDTLVRAWGSGLTYIQICDLQSIVYTHNLKYRDGTGGETSLVDIMTAPHAGDARLMRVANTARNALDLTIIDVGADLSPFSHQSQDAALDCVDALLATDHGDTYLGDMVRYYAAHPRAYEFGELQLAEIMAYAAANGVGRST